jgi:hypothetical protein
LESQTLPVAKHGFEEVGVGELEILDFALPGFLLT